MENKKKSCPLVNIRDKSFSMFHIILNFFRIVLFYFTITEQAVFGIIVKEFQAINWYIVFLRI